MRRSIATLKHGDPIESIIEGSELHTELLGLIADSAAIRRSHIRYLRANGWSGRAVADAAGISYQRVYQLEAGADRKEKG
jgi:hypothetical protein